MTQYRKKPVVIEAEQFHPQNKPYPDGVETYTKEKTEEVDGTTNEWYGWRILTLEGIHEVSPGDWIITGVKGEKYACKPDIFDMTYEKVEEAV